MSKIQQKVHFPLFHPWKVCVCGEERQLKPFRPAVHTGGKWFSFMSKPLIRSGTTQKKKTVIGIALAFIGIHWHFPKLSRLNCVFGRILYQICMIPAKNELFRVHSSKRGLYTLLLQYTLLFIHTRDLQSSKRGLYTLLLHIYHEDTSARSCACLSRPLLLYRPLLLPPHGPAPA